MYSQEGGHSVRIRPLSVRIPSALRTDKSKNLDGQRTDSADGQRTDLDVRPPSVRCLSAIRQPSVRCPSAIRPLTNNSSTEIKRLSL